MRIVATAIADVRRAYSPSMSVLQHNAVRADC